MSRKLTVRSEVRKFLARIGRRGGNARAKRYSREERKATARRAALSRWMRDRFGIDKFEDTGLPGWEIIDQGLRHLADGKVEEVEALIVAELRPRLQYLGVPVPKIACSVSNAREELYRRIEHQHGALAHERFSAALRRADSFCDAVSFTWPIRSRRVRRDRAWWE